MSLRHFVFIAISSLTAAAHAQYVQENLVSDGSVLANHVDPQLANPWGLTSSSTSPVWISDNFSSLSTLYMPDGTKLGLTVSVPGNPTGIVFNSAGGFNNSFFIFAGLDGKINGWGGGPSASLLFDWSPFGGSYTGLAILGQNIYGADNATGTVDVFNNSTGFAGTFTDTSLTGIGYSPFGIQAIGGELFVTFAGSMGGYVDEFDPNGNLVRRFASQGLLDCPWGMALAPQHFGKFSGDLLVGNNDAAGWIDAFEMKTGRFVGTLDWRGKPISNPGLWGLRFGNGAGSGPVDTLFLTAGANDVHGLYAAIRKEPGFDL